MTVNVPTAIATPPDDFDPFNSASDPAVQSFDLWGKWEINAWACALVKGQGKVPYDQNNPAHKRFTAIEVYIQPLAEIDAKYPKQWEENWIAEFPEWARITLPSIKAAGFENVRETNGLFVRVQRVPNGKKYPKKDRTTGEPTGEMADETTFKVIQFFTDEESCRAAYFAAGGQPGLPSMAHVISSDPNDAEKSTNLAFLKVIVTNAARGKANVDEAKATVALALGGYPTVAKYFTADSPETLDLINQALGAA